MPLGITFRENVATLAWFISNKSLTRVRFKQESDCRYMCYCITLYNVQCQDNVNIVYNNILLYKILINKSIIKITYVTTSIPILPDIVWFNNTVVIQCTVCSIHWQLVQYSFSAREACVIRYMTHKWNSGSCGQWLASYPSTLGHVWDACSVRLRYARIHVASVNT